MQLRRPHFLALVAASALLAALACRDTAAPRRPLLPDSPAFELTKKQLNRIELDNVCGNRFRVRNPSMDTLELTWRVAKSSDSGSFQLLPKPDSGRSEAFFTTRDTGKVQLFYQGKKIDKEKEGREPPCPFHLTSYVGDGVNPELWPADTSLANPGGSIRYAFAAASGYASLEVFVDGAVAPSSGTVAMTANHWIVARAQPVITLDANEAQLAGKLRALLTSGDPKSAYVDYVNTSAQLEQLWGPDAATHEARVQSATIDPVADSANLRRVDLALAGSSFDVDGQGVMTNSRAPAAKRGFDPRRSGAVVVPIDTMEETTVYYVNGIFNAVATANYSTGQLRNVLGTFPSSSPRISLGSLYNPSVLWQRQGRARVIERCNEQLSIDGLLRAGLRPSQLFSDWMGCAASGYARFFHENFDLVEALRLQDSLLANSVTVGQSDPVAQDLATQIGQTLQAGRHAILVGHSEGSIMAQLVAQVLRNRGTYRPDITPQCLGIVSVAGLTTANWPLSDRYTRFVVAKGDIVTIPPGTNGKPTIETAQTRAVDQYLADRRAIAAADPTNPVLTASLALAVRWEGIKLHDFTEHYLTAPELKTAITDGVVGIYPNLR